MPVPQRVSFLWVGILPARQRLIEMGTVEYPLGEAIAVELLEVRSHFYQYVLKFIVNAHICDKGLEGDRDYIVIPNIPLRFSPTGYSFSDEWLSKR
ncbi:hypothetical protein QUB75_25935 [Microcoleus sp. K1-B6]|uniref:hypothetical protein n=1 Tax=unclassified Microcoleus TaxID=2642155 RepID=UPI002FD2337A